MITRPVVDSTRIVVTSALASARPSFTAILLIASRSCCSMTWPTERRVSPVSVTLTAGMRTLIFACSSSSPESYAMRTSLGEP
jgi:hypothetical protein